MRAAALLAAAFAATNAQAKTTREKGHAAPRPSYTAPVPCGRGLKRVGHATWDGGPAVAYALQGVAVTAAGTAPCNGHAHGAGRTAPHHRVRAVFSALPTVGNDVSITVCAPREGKKGQRARLAASFAPKAPAHIDAAKAAVLGVSVDIRLAGELGTNDDDDAGAETVLHVQVPWAALRRMLSGGQLPPVVVGAPGELPLARRPVASRVAACSNGRDDDGDRLTDLVDPACAGGAHVDDEAADNDAGTNLSWLWGHEHVSAWNVEWDFMRELNWTYRGRSRRVHWDEPSHWTAAQRASSEPCRFYPLGSNCSQWVLSVAFLGWGNRTFSTLPELNQTLVSANATTAVFVTRTKQDLVEVETVYQLRGDAVVLATTVTSLVAGQAVEVLINNPLGSLQLGSIDPATGNTTVSSSGLWTLDGKRGGSLSRGASGRGVSTTRGSGWPNDMSGFSGVGAMGDSASWAVGFQLVDPSVTDDGAVEWGVTMAATGPHTPSIASQVKVTLAPGAPRTVMQRVQFGPPAPSLAAADAALAPVVRPYAEFFRATHGSVPEYCPTPMVAWEMATDHNGYNRSTLWWPNGSRLYDMLLVDSDRELLGRASTPFKIVWAAAIQSVHLTPDGSSCEFDPNSDVIDPHVDAFWDADAVWANVTRAYEGMGAGLGWFGRPCTEVLAPDNATSATVVPVSTSPRKWRVVTGECRGFDNLTDAQVSRAVARYRRLIDRGVRAWYWDSYGCASRLRVARAVKAHCPECFIMREGETDLDALLLTQFPWYSNQGPYEPDHTHLGRLVLPNAEIFFGELASPPPQNASLAALNQSANNGWIMSTPKSTLDGSECLRLQASYRNYIERMKAYGSARGCKLFPPPRCNDTSPAPTHHHRRGFAAKAAAPPTVAAAAAASRAQGLTPEAAVAQAASSDDVADAECRRVLALRDRLADAVVALEVPHHADVVWGRRPQSETGFGVTVCASSASVAATPQCTAEVKVGGGKAVVVSDCAAAGVALVVRVGVPVDALGGDRFGRLLAPPTGRLALCRQRASAATCPGCRRGASRVAGCSDGVDNDGDMLTDSLDPSCRASPWASELRRKPEGAASASAFSWTLANDAHGNDYMATLDWADPSTGKTHAVIDQRSADKGGGVVYFPHSDTGPNHGPSRFSSSDLGYVPQYGHWNGWQYFNFSRNDPQSHATTTPWAPNRFYNESIPPLASETERDIRTAAVADADGGGVTFTSASRTMTVVSRTRFAGSVATVACSVTLHSSQPYLVFFPHNLGNLQVGKLEAGSANDTGLWHLSQKWNGAIQRGMWSRADPSWQGKGWTGEPFVKVNGVNVRFRGNEYPSLGSVAPVSAVGDGRPGSVAVGVMFPDEQFAAQQTTMSVEEFDTPRAPVAPLLQSWVGIQMRPGETRNFTLAYTVAAGPGSWDIDAIKPVVAELAEPYVTYFHRTFGSTPRYCPNPSLGWMMATDRTGYYNRSTLWWDKGARMYDALNIDHQVDVLTKLNLRNSILWAACIQSAHLSLLNRSCEFNANCDIFDPNTDAGCDADGVFRNITLHMASFGVSLGNFERPCNEIVSPSYESANMTCDGSGRATVVNKGECQDFDLIMPGQSGMSAATSPQFDRTARRVEHLLDMGFRAFYFDSFDCRGRHQYEKFLLDKHGDRINMIMKEGHGDVDMLYVSQLPWMGVWGFEPDNHILTDLLVPAATQYVGEMGPDGGANVTEMLQRTKSTAFLMSTSHASVSPEECDNLHTGYANWQWRMAQYGTALGCQHYDPPQPCNGTLRSWP